MSLIYLAARYSCHPFMRIVREQLKHLGHEVTSRWIEGNHEAAPGLSPQATDAERLRFAVEDYEDLASAEWCISFTEEPRATNGRGGRHVEFGAALALGKRLIVVGHRENVFHNLAVVDFYPTWEAALAAIAEAATAEVDTDEQDPLRAICREFIRKHRITCAEATAEDRVYENAPDLVEAMADILGYAEMEA